MSEIKFWLQRALIASLIGLLIWGTFEVCLHIYLSEGRDAGIAATVVGTIVVSPILLFGLF